MFCSGTSIHGNTIETSFFFLFIGKLAYIKSSKKGFSPSAYDLCKGIEGLKSPTKKISTVPLAQQTENQLQNHLHMLQDILKEVISLRFPYPKKSYANPLAAVLS